LSKRIIKARCRELFIAITLEVDKTLNLLMVLLKNSMAPAQYFLKVFF
jgi:hypothetical protein